MKILHRYLAHEIFGATILVFVALLMLFAFFDLINELNDLGKGHYKLLQMFAFVILSLPQHIYELLPVAALIGTLVALGQLSTHSEFTVMRVSGLPAWRIAASLARVGLVFAALTFVFGEFVAPASETAAQQLRLRAMNTMVAQEFRSGTWVKDERSFINIKEILPNSALIGIKIYEFDPAYRLRTISFAMEAEYTATNTWTLSRVEQTRFDQNTVSVAHLPKAIWHSALTPDILSVLLAVPEQMSAWNLYFYIQHLHENKQKATRYETALWAKLIYPFAALVMVILALPFAYGQTRRGGVGGKILAGIMIGLLFNLLNRVSSHLGLLNDWYPPLAAGLPALLFLGAAGFMLWRVERR